MLPRNLATAVIVAVTIVWVLNFVGRWVVVDYKPDPEINTIFSAAIGTVLALGRKEKNEKKSGGDGQ